jgi:glyoxylase-like metal-dependent hydrolase (beta-lactamase superfamily II)
VKTLFTFGHSPGMTTFFVTGLSWPIAFVGDSDVRQLHGWQCNPFRGSV